MQPKKTGGASARRVGIASRATVMLLGLAGQVFGADATVPAETAQPIELLARQPPVALLPPLKPPEKYPYRALLEASAVLAGGSVEVLRRTGTLPDLNVSTTERRGQLSLSLVWS